MAEGQAGPQVTGHLGKVVVEMISRGQPSQRAESLFTGEKRTDLGGTWPVVSRYETQGGPTAPVGSLSQWYLHFPRCLA